MACEFKKLSIFGTQFEVTTRYDDLQPVGMGAFGLVCSAKDEVSDSCGVMSGVTEIRLLILVYAYS